MSIAGSRSSQLAHGTASSYLGMGIELPRPAANTAQYSLLIPFYTSSQSIRCCSYRFPVSRGGRADGCCCCA